MRYADGIVSRNTNCGRKDNGSQEMISFMDFKKLQGTGFKRRDWAVQEGLEKAETKKI